MSAPWIRVPPEREHTAQALVAAAAVAGVVGLATFYLTRLLSARERLSGEGPPEGHGRGDAGKGGRA